MKIVKKLVKFVLWLVGIVVVLVLTMPLWIGPVARVTAHVLVPKETGTDFNLGVFGLNPYSGVLTVGDMQLANPEGFKQKMAATLGQLHVDVDMGSLLSDTIVVEDVVLKDVFVSYVSNAKGEKNFDIIAKNASGDEKPVSPKTSQPSQTSQTSHSSQPPKKIIIDHVLIENVLVQLGPISVPVPKIELTGIGRQSGGVTMPEAWSQVSAQVMASLNAIGEFANQLGKMGIDLGKRVDIKGMGDALKNGAKIFSQGTDKSVDSVNESTEKAVNAIKGLFK